MAAEKDHYQVLEVSRDEDPEGIRKAFRRLAKECHPDVAGPDGIDRFKEIAQAHEVLTDPEKRVAYDDTLRPEPMNERWGAPSVSKPVDERWGTPVAPEPMRPTRRDRQRSVDLELLLTSREAMLGGDFEMPLRFSVSTVCQVCDGFGRGSLVGLCPWCRGRGVIRDKVVLSGLVTIPSGLRSGGRLTVDLGRGYPTLNLWVTVVPG